MHKNQHTPGPWQVSGRIVSRTNGRLMKSSIDYMGGEICTVAGLGNESEETREANARLIAAAPNLLDTLQMVNARIQDTECAGFEPLDTACFNAVQLQQIEQVLSIASTMEDQI